MLSEWMKDIMVCGILFSLLLYMAPNPGMKRYIQTVVGAVMVIMVLSPVMKLMKCEDRLNFNLYRESVGNYIDSSDDEIYVNAMEKVVAEYIKEKRGFDTRVHIELSPNMDIRQMTIYIDWESVNINADENIDKTRGSIKSDAAGKYGLDEELITVI